MKFYAIVNRQGTMVRIKPQHANLFNYLANTRGGKIPPADQNAVELFSKKNFQIIRGELRMGFKESHIRVVDSKRTGELVIGDESMKKEIINAQKFMKKVEEIRDFGKEEEE